ncbi:hypothetical protein PYCCODRAFT_1082341 [Trametes coccinea BRFM310]|uniref:Uncharacterized protein n=1 Tax=Trametes coccinea (strain BRFM310) TaxID=1353009 RepID=A0A1Y2IY92_TRAC3|nr:hypothetical protein PYCCODRAFT_1082341 [Trametes coccinea BRFM310]
MKQRLLATERGAEKEHPAGVGGRREDGGWGGGRGRRKGRAIYLARLIPPYAYVSLLCIICTHSLTHSRCSAEPERIRLQPQQAPAHHLVPRPPSPCHANSNELLPRRPFPRFHRPSLGLPSLTPPPLSSDPLTSVSGLSLSLSPCPRLASPPLP